VTKRTRIIVATIAALSAGAAACGGPSDDAAPNRTGESMESGMGAESFSQPVGDAEAYPVLASSELVVGENRLLVGLLDDNDAPIGTPGIDVGLSFYDLEESATQVVSETGTDFIWSVPGERGVYVANVSFDHAGKWGAEARIRGQGLNENVRFSFEVKKDATSPAVGQPAPPSDTPTAAEVKDLSTITSDSPPDPDMYQMSVADAIQTGKPFVVTFATPKFCQSAVCGPTLDIVKRVAKDFRDVNFLHVEVYENLDDPSNLKVVPAVEEWGLPSEPWVFVVDADGKVAAKYEGVVGAGELRRELQSL
jgi:hypothetical protein